MIREPRDNQRGKLYKWEREQVWFDRVVSPNLPHEEGVKYLARLWVQLGMGKGTPYQRKPPTLKFNNRKHRGGAWAWSSLIEYGPGACRRWVLAHEASHSVIARLGVNPVTAAHGPEFAAIFCAALHRGGIMDAVDALHSMRRFGLEVCGPTLDLAMTHRGRRLSTPDGLRSILRRKGSL